MIKVKSLSGKMLGIFSILVLGASSISASETSQRVRKVLITKSDASGTFVSSSPVRLVSISIGSAAVNSSDFVICVDTGTPASNTATHNYNSLLVAPALFASTTNVNNGSLNQTVSVMQLNLDLNSGLVCRLSNAATPAFVYIQSQ